MQHNKEQEKKNREYLKRTTRCISCSQRDAYTIAGRSYCFDCLQKNLKMCARYRENNREVINKKARERTAKRKENGLCIQCGKKLLKNSCFSRCEDCRGKRRRKERWVAQKRQQSIED